jgi:hypothetical protein
MESNSFTYHALNSHTDEIRLVSLEPCDLSQVDAQVACTLITVKLSENPKYEALSYMWGSLSNSATIAVDGQDLSVGENLWLALKQLRLGASRRTIWIDAICINQADTTERNHQVSQMSNIYSCAEQVLVWLGPDTVFSDQAMRFLADVADGTIPSIGCDKPVFGDCWKAVEQFCESEYWKRLWIIQEVVLARKVLVMWGAAVIPFTDFHTVCERTKLLKDFRSWNYRFILQLPDTLPAKLSQRRGETRMSNGTGATLLDLMAIFLHAACKDEKDKVFGLLSLSDSCCRDSMPIEYSRSAFDLYNKAFSHHAEYHLGAKNDHLHKATTLFLRHQLHEASKEHPRSLKDGVSTIIFTGLLENIGGVIRDKGIDFPKILEDQLSNSATTWKLPYHNISPWVGGLSIMKLAGERQAIVDIFRALHETVRLPLQSHPGRYLKTIQVQSFLADDGTVGFVPPSVMGGDKFFRSSDGVSLTIKRLDSSGSGTVIATAKQYPLRYPDIEQSYWKFRI